MPFESDRLVVARESDDTWRLMSTLVYRGKEDTFVVAPGFVTDFASVPRIAVWLIPRFGRYTRAAIVHDWLCQRMPVDPVDVDGIFRRIMREEGVPPVKRWLMWVGVRWGALTNKHRREGWAKTAPAVIGITLLALPLAVPMLGVAAGLTLYGAAEWIVTGGEHAGTIST
jgi:hypothetical protein